MGCLEQRGFGKKWCEWIKSVLYNGTVVVKLNGQVGPYFQSFKGVRQGDPLSPLHFNLAADCLVRMMHKAQQNDLITGLVEDLIPKGIAVLQYANDTIICLKHDLDKARNMKMLLYMFEQMSELKINFEKSEIVVIGNDDNVAISYVEAFNCQIGAFPLKYLGGTCVC
jgi:hypothetical protein